MTMHLDTRLGPSLWKARPWLVHDSRTSSRRGIVVALAATSLVLIGCGGPRFESVATNETGKNGATSLSVPVPPSTSGEASQDLLIAILGAKSNPNTTGPSEWAAIPGFGGFNAATCVADAGGIGCQLAVFYTIADGSETSASFTWGGTHQAAGAVLRYSNVDTSSPIGAARSQRGASATPTAPIITTTTDGSRLIRIALADAADAMAGVSGSAIFSREPRGRRFNMMSFPDSATDPTNGCGPPLSDCDDTSGAVGLTASDTGRGAAGPSGPADWSLGGSDQWLTASVEIRAPSP